jgi:uncharacterized protein YqgC (DUF456 family)
VSAFDVAVALVIAVGLVGILLPVLPGSVLVLAAVLAWAVHTGGALAWIVLAVVATLLAAGSVVKYVVPNRRLQEVGVPASTQWAGAVLAVVGFFVVPVVGLLLGFVLGVYAAEHHRVGARLAWPSTLAAVRAAGLSILIELIAGVVAAGVWLTAVVVA